MKGLKKLALASTIAAVSAGAQAELKALDDSAMGELTGQAGLTIDIETKWSIGEFMYKDAGSILISGLSMGGNTASDVTDGNGGTLTNTETSSYLDNIRMTLDVAGADAVDNARLNYGFSEIGKLSAFLVANGNTEAQFASIATALTDNNPTTLPLDYGVSGSTPVGAADLGVGQWGALGGSAAQTTEAGDAVGVEDGDLVIHWGFTDPMEFAGGFAKVANGAGEYKTRTDVGLDAMNWVEARDIATRAVDFNFNIDSISLADSTYTAGELVNGGSTSAQTTTLISGLNLRGYLGPSDLHIENDGNGFGADGSGVDFDNDGANDAGTGFADSKITWGSYFRVTDLDVYIDIAGISLEGVEIKNTRGDLTGLDGTSSFGFAHSRRTIYAVSDSVLHLDPAATTVAGNYTDGLALNTEFKGDIDIEALRFGGINNGESIGSIYLTDIDSDTKWTISAH